MIKVCVYYKNDSYFHYGEVNHPLLPNMDYVRVFYTDSLPSYKLSLSWSVGVIYRIIKK